MISVAIPTCNRPDYLEVALRSVLSQTITPDEVIISEDGSDPETCRRVQQLKTEYPHITIKHFTSPSQTGDRANRLRAFGLTSGEYVAMLDDDDVWDSRFLEKTYAVLKNDPSLHFCTTNHSLIDKDGKQLEKMTKDMMAYNGRGRLVTGRIKDVFHSVASNNGLIFSLQFTLFRRSRLEQQCFIPDFGIHLPDLALFLMLGVTGAQGYFLEDFLGSCRVHGGQQTANRLRNTESHVECLHTLYIRFGKNLSAQQLTAFKRRYRKIALELAIAHAHVGNVREAINCLGKVNQHGFGVPSFKRLAVLAALLMGVRKHA
jgi:glycosyltransferase involved in cell wall biosynthesis